MIGPERQVLVPYVVLLFNSTIRRIVGLDILLAILDFDL